MQMDCCVRPKRAKARSCVHVVEALKNSDAKGLFSAAFRKARDMEAGVATRLSCGSCGDREGWLHVCVACGFVGCFKKSGHEFSIQRHIRQHMSQNASHSFAVSTVTPSSVYCNECRDYVHNDTLEHLSRVERAAAVSVLLKSSVTTPFVMWTPVARDQKALSEQAAKLSAPAHFAGLRGLLNLGSTCFLNVIMQAGFVHNPIVRNYFLSDLHNSASCKAAACLMCQVDRFMAEMFSCEPQPFACHQFLFAMWQHSDYLAGYEQQDAHEFLISLFNGLHTSARTLDLPSRCSCVVHQSFGSTLRSECTCSSCGYVSTSVEPCLDISLEIPEELRQDGAPPCLLENCLAGFTHSEVLGDDDRLKCERCGSLQQARKQMSIESPPVVLCLQIKRFQRTMGTRKMVSSKIETQVKFPSELDLIPYLSSSVVGKDQAVGTVKKRAQSISYMYDLFAVINHHGSLDNGHYTCFVQQQMGGGNSNEWVKCDDAVLTRVKASEVHNSQCYILFYCKRFMEYN